MSRVAKNPITIPDSVKVSIENSIIEVSGSKGNLNFKIPDSVSLNYEENIITVQYQESQQSVALAGTTRALVNNMVIGVSEGFQKKLQLVGVGYRAKASGKLLELSLGFSHPVKYKLPEDVLSLIHI